tara:strand:+ start:296 stop:586 length:291 start_codon:yes stop_codon:yes gene_type:complete
MGRLNIGRGYMPSGKLPPPSDASDAVRRACGSLGLVDWIEVEVEADDDGGWRVRLSPVIFTPGPPDDDGKGTLLESLGREQSCRVFEDGRVERLLA